METNQEETRPDDPTTEADEADPTAPGPGDSDGAHPTPDVDREEPVPPEPAGGVPDDAADSSPDAASGK